MSTLTLLKTFRFSQRTFWQRGASTQSELYDEPRWTHLSNEAGGTNGNGGLGNSPDTSTTNLPLIIGGTL